LLASFGAFDGFLVAYFFEGWWGLWLGYGFDLFSHLVEFIFVINHDFFLFI
jgi:hypothetical protein